MEDTKAGRQDKDAPAQVARQNFEALTAGKDKIAAGSARTKAQGFANKILPYRIEAQAHRKMAEPGSGTDA
ncbi:hypothetical protein [Kitasatospora sp. NPDC098663]|uniref:hypothetical protein n=1 Tax=Kitasatospora sp. NPDC098663 TaxID=3364096 RepID=UPI00381EEC94